MKIKYLIISLSLFLSCQDKEPVKLQHCSSVLHQFGNYQSANLFQIRPFNLTDQEGHFTEENIKDKICVVVSFTSCPGICLNDQ
jgi:cytochrome oxidase Cu insertion factor (SCO1/SenC/PrrC family)